jgi:3-dehydroquinate synthase
MAEVVKIAVTCDPELLDLIEANAQALKMPPIANDSLSDVRTQIIRRAIQAKIDVVARDPQETGERVVLNFGHTLGHAIESAAKYQLRHGECVAIGMCGALQLGERLGITDKHLRSRVVSLIEALGLPTRARVRLPLAARYLARDKKRDKTSLRFVFPRVAGAWKLHSVDIETAREALSSVIVSL